MTDNNLITSVIITWLFCDNKTESGLTESCDPSVFLHMCVPVGGGGTRLDMLGLMSGRKEEGVGLTSLLPGDM